MSNVAPFVGGAVGGVVGFWIGGPYGAFKGAMLGMALGGSLFPPEAETEKTSPSKIEIPTAESGIAIPVIYGANIVSGNIIWYGNFKSTFIEADEGGKGSGGSKGEQQGGYYTYTVSFAMGLCMGPATVLRAWAGKSKVNLTRFRIYTGDQTTNDTVFDDLERPPVWKNLCYIVAENYKLGSTPSIPLLTFEVARITTIEDEAYHYWTGDTFPYIGSLATTSNKLMIGGGDDSSTARIDIYDPFVYIDTSRPSLSSSCIDSITCNDTYTFVTRSGGSATVIYIYLTEDLSYVDEINLSSVTSKITALICNDLHVFACYDNGSTVGFRAYKCSDFSYVSSLSFTTTSITNPRNLKSLAVSEKYFYAGDITNKRLWRISRKTGHTVTSLLISPLTPYDIDLTHNKEQLWVVVGTDTIYIYNAIGSPMVYLRSITDSTNMAYARKIKFLHEYNRYFVFNSFNISDTEGWVSAFSTGISYTETSDPATKFVRRFNTESGPISRITTNGSFLATLEDGTIRLYDFGGDFLAEYTGKTDFIDISQTELGIYAIDGTSTVYFYALGLDYTFPTVNSIDIRSVAEENLAGLHETTAIYASTIDDVNYLWVAWNNSAIGLQRRYRISLFTLASDGKVSTSTFRYNMKQPSIGGYRIRSMKATSFSITIVCDIDGETFDTPYEVTHMHTIKSYNFPNGDILQYDRTKSWITFEPLLWLDYVDIAIGNDLTTIWAVLYDETKVGTYIYKFNEKGLCIGFINQDTYLDATSAILFHAGKLYIGDINSDSSYYINIYSTEGDTSRRVKDQLPTEITQDMLTNDLYGLGLDADTYIDFEESLKTNSYCVDKDLLIALVFDTQTSILDALQEVITQHNGFITYREGKIAHGQLQFNSDSDDCVFTLVTNKSDSFDDGAISSTIWSKFSDVGSPSSYSSEGSGVLNVGPINVKECYAGVETESIVYGAFDVKVDYSGFTGSSPDGDYGLIGLMFYIDSLNWAYIGRQRNSSTNRYTAKTMVDGSERSISTLTTNTSGSFEIIRKGKIIYLYYNSIELDSYEEFSILGGKIRLFIYAEDTNITVETNFDNYEFYRSGDSIYPENIVRAIGSSSSDSLNDIAASVTVRGQKERYNQVTVEYTNRSKDYTIESVNRDDSVDVSLYGKNLRSVRLEGIKTEARAKLMCDLLLFQSLAQAFGANFSVGWKNLSLRPGDLAWLTDDTLELYHQPVRIASISESDQGILEVEVRFEEDIYFADSYVDVVNNPSEDRQPNQTAGDVYDITILQPDQTLIKNNNYEFHFFYSLPVATNDIGGVSIYKSYASDGSYKKIGQTLLSGLIGYVVGVGVDAGEDSGLTNYIDLLLNTEDDLSDADNGVLTSVWENLSAVVLSDDTVVWFQFKYAELYLEDLNRVWRLTGLVYDTNKTAVLNSYGSIQVNDKILIYKNTYRYVVEPKDTTKTLYFKFPTVNPAGEEQSLAECSEVSAVANVQELINSGGYEEGIPAPQIGDAVHLGTDNKIYRGNSLTRRNIIGIKDQDGIVIKTGAVALPDTTDFTIGNIFLKIPESTITDDPGAPTTSFHLRDNSPASWAMSQSFTVENDGDCIIAVVAKIYRAGDTEFTLTAEIRTDNGGVPSSTILAVSEGIYGDDAYKIVPNSAGVLTDTCLYFRFTDFYELEADTTYHIVFRTDAENLGGTIFFYVQGFSTDTIPGYRCNCAVESLGTWVTYATEDIWMRLVTVNLLDTSGSNLVSTHPFEHTDQYIYHGTLPVISLGILNDIGEIILNVITEQSKLLYSSGKLSNSAARTGAWPSTVEDVWKPKILSNSVICTNINSRILVLWESRLNNAVDTMESKIIWGGVESAVVSENQVTFSGVFNTAVFTNGLSGVQSLAMAARFTTLPVTGTYCYINYVTILGV